ncbi:TetR family transcriptional regulator protein (plasmid) [Chondrocystis sp. NIES-4102]|nr:TetR family transcriptional regulator protein [Chondrocystis sp. NIES-4102]
MTTHERLTRQNWLETGLNLLGTHGEKALTIERLCKITNRSKGSFYHHFKNRDEFTVAILEHWQSEYTDRIISTVDRLDNLAERRQTLDRLVARLDSQIERAIRNWSGSDERVWQVLKSVDEKRIEYVAKLIGDSGQLERKIALELAIIEYATFIGLQHLYPDAEDVWIEQIFLRLAQLTVSFND